MHLPDHHRAVIPEPKITEYLLSPTHPHGRHKAEFFTAIGFSQSNWQELVNALRQHVSDNEVAKVEPSPFGTRYVIEGILKAPDGRLPSVRSVWMIRHGEQLPQFVSAYPLKRKYDD
jgi:hypothetical protein